MKSRTKKFSVTDSLVFGIRAIIDDFGFFFVATLIYITTIIISFTPAFLFSLFTLSPLFNKKFYTASSSISMLLIRGKFYNALTSVTTLLSSPELYVSLFFFAAIYSIMSAGSIKMTIDYLDKGSSSIKTLFAGFLIAPRIIFATILVFALEVSCVAMIMVALYYMNGLNYICTMVNQCIPTRIVDTTYLLMIALPLYIVVSLLISLRLGLYKMFLIDQHAGSFASLYRSFKATRHHSGHFLKILLFALFKIALFSLLINQFVHLNAIPFVTFLLIPLGYITTLANTFAYRQLHPAAPIG